MKSFLLDINGDDGALNGYFYTINNGGWSDEVE